MNTYALSTTLKFSCDTSMRSIPDPVCLNPSDVTPVMAARLKEPESTSPLQAAEGPRHESQQQEEGSQWEKIKIRALFATMNYILMESKSG